MNRIALKYPAEVVDGRLVIESRYPELVRQAIIHTINTKQGELVWHPEYGTGYIVLDKPAPDVLREIREALEFSLQSYPQVTFKLYSRPTDDGAFNLVVAYETPDGLSEDINLVIR